MEHVGGGGAYIGGTLLMYAVLHKNKNKTN